METFYMNTRPSICSLAVFLTLPLSAWAQDSCTNRGQLDTLYCDENRDLVADAPKDPSKWRDPATLVWAYTPIEDPAVYANAFKPFTEHLEKCVVGKRIVYFPVQSNAAQIEAMRSGRLHFTGFSTGPTGFAVNLAGAVPFAAQGTGDQVLGYNLLAVVKASSPYKTLADLKGKKVAHTSPLVRFSSSDQPRLRTGDRLMCVIYERKRSDFDVGEFPPTRNRESFLPVWRWHPLLRRHAEAASRLRDDKT